MQSFENLCGWFESLDGVMVAVSGGVDSALVAAAAYKTLGRDTLKGRAGLGKINLQTNRHKTYDAKL